MEFLPCLMFIHQFLTERNSNLDKMIVLYQTGAKISIQNQTEFGTYND